MIPLSFAQRRLWFLWQLGGPGFAYSLPFTFRLSGRLETDALAAALCDVIARHQVLRTVYRVVDGEPAQHVIGADTATLPLRIADAGTEEEAAVLVASAARQPFDLSADLPVRVLLLRIRPDEHVLAIVVHHIAADAWSLGPLARDLSAAYTARRVGRAPDLAPLPVQYADYALWQRELLGNENDPHSPYREQLAYWRAALAGLPGELDLPADRPRPVAASGTGAAVAIRVPAQVHARLAAQAREQGASVFMVVLAAFAVLLSKLGAGTDIPVGTPVAGRAEDELDELVGFFVNTLVLRVSTAGDPAFTDLVGRVRDTALDAYGYQDLPFERLVEELAPDRSMGRHPLFQVMLTVQSQAAPSLALPGLTVAPLPASGQGAKFDLDVQLGERFDDAGRPAGLDGTLTYAADRFDHGTAETVTARFERVLAAVAANPRRRVHEIDVLAEAERRQLLADWNDTARDLPADTVIDLFEAQTARTPDAVAVSGAGTELTYAELDVLASRFAAELAAGDAGPERAVALVMGRSVQWVVAVLAVLKTGAAFLPLDPDHPAGRIDRMLADAAPVIILGEDDVPRPGDSYQAASDNGEDADWAGEPARPIGRVERGPADADLARAHRADDADRARGAAVPGGGAMAVSSRGPARPWRLPGAAAYVIYTSGSTGEPKGVVVSNGALATYIQRVRATYPGLGRSTALHSSPSFDFTYTALFGALTTGGRMHLTDWEAGDLPAVPPAFLKATPSHLAYLDALGADYAPAQELMLGGEALGPVQAGAWRGAHPGVAVINEYGPTETTIAVTDYRVGPGEPVPSGVFPIGRPTWNTRVYVLGAALELVPAGVAGELYVAGGQLARGYLREPGVTAERFTACPYGPAGTVMYRTGDLARWRPEGVLEHLGRADRQVKVRGYRVEPGEIEKVLLALPGIAQAAVVARRGAAGETTLAAYLVGSSRTSDAGSGTLDSGRVIDTEAVRRRLAAVLPEQMRPAAIVVLDALPLTVNGKLDETALPAPVAETASGLDRPEAVTAAEEVLCGVFAEVLGVALFGPHDNFFARGGHSFRAVTLVERLRARGIDLDVRALFSAPTPAALAAGLALRTSPGGTAPGETGHRDKNAAGLAVPARRMPDGAQAITPDMLPLVELTQEQLAAIAARTPGGAANIADIYPLAPLQEGIFFHYPLAAGAADAHVLRTVLAFDDRGRLDAFTAALQRVVDRHDILRTAFHWHRLPEPVQVVLRQAPVQVHEVELRPGLASAAERLMAACPAGMPVTSAPLIHVYTTLDPGSPVLARRSRKGGARWLALLHIHHLIHDHTATEILLGEFRAVLAGQADTLPEPVPFRDFVFRLRARENRADHAAYFGKLLGDVTDTTAPFGILEVRGDGTTVTEARTALDDGLAAAIRERARQLGVSPATLFHVAYARLVGALAGRDDVVFGTLLFGRVAVGAGADRAPGLFLNTLPVRARLGAVTALDAVRDMQGQLAWLLAHEGAPLSAAQQASGVPGGVPLFTALLNYRHSAPAGTEPPDKRPGAFDGIELVMSQERTSCPLVVSVADTGTGLAVTAHAAAPIRPKEVCRWLATAVAGLSDELATVFEGPVVKSTGLPGTGTGAPGGQPGILGSDERREVIEGYNATFLEVAERSVAELFEARAAAEPERAAVTDAGQHITYGDLNARADKLARCQTAPPQFRDFIARATAERR